MTRRTIISAVLAIFGLILILYWIEGGFHSKVPGGNTSLKKDEQRPLRTIKAERHKMPTEVVVSGTVVSKETARIASRILGYVLELHVDAGQKVTKDQILLKIDTKEASERLEQAKAALVSAKADLVRTRNDFDRYKALFEKDSVARKDYDDALARFEVAKAAESRASAAVDEAQTMLSYGNISAPFDGIVAERNVNVGDLANPGKTLLTIYAPGTLEMTAAVGEQYSSFLSPGTVVEVAIPSISLKQSSSIREVVPQRDERTRTITIKSPLKEATGLVPGLYGTLSFRTRSSESIIIPISAVTSVGQLESVKVFENGTSKIRNVRTGRRLQGDKIEIISGLNPGDEIIVTEAGN